MGTFIVLEGGEGCGKSTQARLLYRRLLEEGYPSLLLHEPGGTPLGEQVRRLLMAQRGERKGAISPLAELLLFSTARAELVQKVLRPALTEGRVVVCDRYTPSTIAYQGYGRGIPLETIDQVNRLSTESLKPDLVVLLDMKPEDGLRRVRAQVTMDVVPGPRSAEPRGSEEGSQRFEQESLAFHRKVRHGYLEQARSEPQRWLRVKGTLSQERIAEVIWERVELLVRRQGGEG
ncbi:MAG: dTMP kinase [Chloroflexota bacterium]